MRKVLLTTNSTLLLGKKRFIYLLKIVHRRLVIENTSSLKIFCVDNKSGLKDFENNLSSLYGENTLFDKNTFDKMSFEKLCCSLIRLT